VRSGTASDLLHPAIAQDGHPTRGADLTEPAAATARAVGTSQPVGSTALEGCAPIFLHAALAQGEAWLQQGRGSAASPARVKVQLSCCTPKKRA